jgi:hypothetical protein
VAREEEKPCSTFDASQVAFLMKNAVPGNEGGIAALIQQQLACDGIADPWEVPRVLQVPYG